MEYKTPGIFVEELSAPAAVTAIAIAVPAFIGHTAFAEDANGISLVNIPTKIASLQEYAALFGGSYDPAFYTISIDPGADFSILQVMPAGGKKYYLGDAIRHYFDNGGGPCYIVSTGSYDTDVIYGTDTSGLSGGLRAVEKMDEPTILVVPDSVALKQTDGSPDFIAAGKLHQNILGQCARLQDRFCILDMVEGYQAPGHVSAPIDRFLNEVGSNNLKYGATYYPWLSTTYQKEVHFPQFHFVDAQVVPVPVPDAVIDSMTGNKVLDGLVKALRTSLNEEQRIFSGITAATVNRNNYKDISAQLGLLKASVLAASTAAVVRPAFSAMMKFVREIVLAFQKLQNDSGNSPALISLLNAFEADATFALQITALIAFEKNANVMNSISTVRAESDVNDDYLVLNASGWTGGVNISSIPANTTDFTNGGANTIAMTAQAAANAPALQLAFNTVSQAFTELAGAAVFRSDQAEQNLFAQHPFFVTVYDRVRKDMSLIPPSGAVAGIYASTDRSRGVWKAPANVSLRSVITPAYKLSDREQGPLNIHETGKSVNAIRAFTGNGSILWGSRTLAGNDNEWRYINVRRFFIFVEESTKNATQQFVFEPNSAGTWIRVRAMIENFLTTQWRQGALAGVTPRNAFFVKVGLGESMNDQDILDGRMIVEIGMAVVRPAEFIILRFSHTMQDS